MEFGDKGKARFDEAADRLAAARENMAGRAADARGNMADRRDAARDAATDAKDRAAEAIARVKPRLRGVSHEYAFFVSLVLGAALIILAKGAEARLAVTIYAASLSALFGVSALYHRVDWKRPESRRWMRRLDHTMIFFLIAGTVTPFALLLMDGPFGTALLVAVWAAAVAGSIVELIWIDAPKWVAAIVYSAVGLIGAIGFPSIAIEAGPAAAVLIAGGGILYLIGAIVYAAQRPDPKPSVFGYHEIFHVLVIAAAAAHFAAVALYALPAS